MGEGLCRLVNLRLLVCALANVIAKLPLFVGYSELGEKV
jgi:hypothetical protein